MSYYRGDYYRGDPGFLGDLVGTITGFATSMIPGPVGGIARAAQRKIFGRKPAQPQVLQYGPATPPILVAGQPGRTKIGYKPGQQLPVPGQPLVGVRKRRRMNVTNDKALRRAIRRTDGFVKLAKRALRGTGYTVVTRSSRAKRVNVRESGAGSVTVH